MQKLKLWLGTFKLLYVALEGREVLPNPPQEQQWKAGNPYGAKHFRSIIAAGCVTDWSEKKCHK